MSGNGRIVGMIGTGLMGTAMSKKLIAAGYTVAGYDPNPEAKARFEAAGGRPLPSLAELAGEVDRALISVFDSAQVEDVIEGPHGLTATTSAARKLKLVINTSTCDPERMAALAQRAKAKGLRFMEMPISGSVHQIASGQALGVIGDNGGDLADAKDVVTTICPRHVPMGPVGNGTKTKLAINHILAINRAALAEGLVFADRIGLPLDAFLAAAKQSFAHSFIMDAKGAQMIAGDFAPQGRIRQSLKDISLIVSTAEAHGQELPLASVYKQLMQEGVDAGEGDIDNAGVIKAIRRRTKTT